QRRRCPPDRRTVRRRAAAAAAPAAQVRPAAGARPRIRRRPGPGHSRTGAYALAGPPPGRQCAGLAVHHPVPSVSRLPAPRTPLRAAARMVLRRRLGDPLGRAPGAGPFFAGRLRTPAGSATHPAVAGQRGRPQLQGGGGSVRHPRGHGHVAPVARAARIARPERRANRRRALEDTEMSQSPIDDLARNAYVDGQLDAAQRRAMEAYLLAHPEQAQELSAWQRDAQELRRAAGQDSLPPNPELDPAAVRARLRARTRRRLAMASSLFVALVLGGATGWSARDSALAHRVLPMQDAVQAYRLFASDHAPQPDLRADAGSLQSWLDDYFAHA